MRWLFAFLVLTGVAVAKEAPKPAWEARFAQANTAGDGRLTLAEAQAGYKTIARHFREIDVEGKGFVTANDVRAWHATQGAARAKKTEDDPLRPRRAFQTVAPGPRPLAKTSSRGVVPAP